MQKEVKVKLITDSVNNFIAKAPPAAHEALKKELDILITNYQRLCSRLNGKCKTLEVGYLVSLFISNCRSKVESKDILSYGITSSPRLSSLYEPYAKHHVVRAIYLNLVENHICWRVKLKEKSQTWSLGGKQQWLLSILIPLEIKPSMWLL